MPAELAASRACQFVLNNRHPHHITDRHGLADNLSDLGHVQWFAQVIHGASRIDSIAVSLVPEAVIKMIGIRGFLRRISS